jgi:protein SCO1/2
MWRRCARLALRCGRALGSRRLGRALARLPAVPLAAATVALMIASAAQVKQPPAPALRLDTPATHSNGPAARGDAALPRLVAPPPGSYVLPVIQPGPDGSVLDTAGRAVPLRAHTSGRVTLLSFMYTYCVDPAGCPLLFSTLYGLRERLQATPELARRVRLVSLSFDPVNDTPETMARYAGVLARADRPLRWDFLTGRSVAELQPILADLGQPVAIQLDAQGKPGRLYYHMLKLFLFDRQGRVREIYSSAFLQPDMIYNDIRTLLLEEDATQSARK